MSNVVTGKVVLEQYHRSDKPGRIYFREAHYTTEYSLVSVKELGYIELKQDDELTALKAKGGDE